jgi:hypothetical protein
MNNELPTDAEYAATPVTLGPNRRPAPRSKCTEAVIPRPLPERQKPQATSTAPDVDYAQYVQQLKEAGFSEAFAQHAARTQMAIEQA